MGQLQQTTERNTPRPSLDAVLHPNSIAVVGASKEPNSQGNKYVRALKEYGFRGEVYPVNPGLDSSYGLQAYPSLSDVPGPVDYVISAIPAHLVLKLVEECVTKGVKGLNLYTARFSETGLAEGSQLERQIAETAKAGGVRVIGPNCMGLYYPAWGISFRVSFPKESGQVAFISQSGGITQPMVSRTAARGVYFSKVISYGNAADVNEAELMDYFADDPETEIITGYIEGVRDGAGFFKAVSKASRIKPVVLLKGGLTSAGTRAVASHTASLAGSEELWSTFIKQTGAISARTMDEMSDITIALTLLKPTMGRRTAVLGGGGGESVAAADACERAGLLVPPIPAYIVASIKEDAPYTWSMIGNPLDGSVTAGPRLFRLVADKLARDASVDVIIGNGNSDFSMDEESSTGSFLDGIRYFIRLKDELDKPLALVTAVSDITPGWRLKAIQDAYALCAEAGVPVFPSMERAANAVGKVIEWRSRKEELEETK